jgi:hypothetical protein
MAQCAGAVELGLEPTEPRRDAISDCGAFACDSLRLAVLFGWRAGGKGGGKARLRG